MKPYDTEQDKKEQVREMFDRIAPAYDRLNHTLSFQIDKLWRRHVVRIVRRMQPRRILDVATGTGDLALAMARRMRGVQVLGVDLSENMLAEARRKATACGLDERVVLSLGDAERLEVADASVDGAPGDRPGAEARREGRYPGVFDPSQSVVPKGVRSLQPSPVARYRRDDLQRPQGIRVPACFGG